MKIQWEAREQEAIFQWIDYCGVPELQLLYHIPNGGYRRAFEAKMLKAQGVKSGVPDLCLPVARGGHHGLYIELKADKTKKPTENQKKWLASLTEQGYKAIVCCGWEEAVEQLKEYMKGGKDDVR